MYKYIRVKIWNECVSLHYLHEDYIDGAKVAGLLQNPIEKHHFDALQFHFISKKTGRARKLHSSARIYECLRLQGKWKFDISSKNYFFFQCTPIFFVMQGKCLFQEISRPDRDLNNKCNIWKVCMIGLRVVFLKGTATLKASESEMQTLIQSYHLLQTRSKSNEKWESIVKFETMEDSHI